jgi:arylsulfatase A-like enzyme
MRSIARFLVTLGLIWTATIAALGSPRTDHVFIISIDGGKPAVLAQSEMPILKRLAAEGASTWSAKTIFPSLTLPSHTSMLTGVEPGKHHILWNTWKPSKGVVRVPTVFAEAKKAGLSTAMFVGKEKFRHLAQPGTVDGFEFGPAVPGQATPCASASTAPWRPSTVGARLVSQQAARYIKAKIPNLCFIHFTDADDTGHRYGWGSPRQRRALGEVDAALETVIKAIDEAGIANRSVLIITADHGGHGRTHGSRRPEDMNIPWIAWGEGVRKGWPIPSLVTTCDTTATALWLLDVPASGALDGKPVVDAFSPLEKQLAPHLKARGGMSGLGAHDGVP